VAAGWKPGWSTDYCAVTLAQDYGIPTVINLTNIDQVYDKDPNKYPDAKPMKHMGWQQYCEMAGDKWIPGMNLPFDPIASRLAQDLGTTVKIVNGKNLANLEKALATNDFLGTVIE
jgi:uridylate kinase